MKDGCMRWSGTGLGVLVLRNALRRSRTEPVEEGWLPLYIPVASEIPNSAINLRHAIRDCAGSLLRAAHRRADHRLEQDRRGRNAPLSVIGADRSHRRPRYRNKS